MSHIFHKYFYNLRGGGKEEEEEKAGKTEGEEDPR